jgi:hypothetical protein
MDRYRKIINAFFTDMVNAEGSLEEYKDAMEGVMEMASAAVEAAKIDLEDTCIQH